MDRFLPWLLACPLVHYRTMSLCRNLDFKIIKCSVRLTSYMATRDGDHQFNYLQVHWLQVGS